MRILIVSDAWHPQVNGVVRTYELIIGQLEARGHIVRVLGPADFKRSFALPGYPEIRLVRTPRQELEDMIAAFRPEAIHIATEGPLGWAARSYCVRNNIPFSTSYHTQFPDYIAKRCSRYLKILYKPAHSLAKILVRNFHRPSDLILVATPGLQENLRAWNFKNDMHLFSRGVDTDLFHPNGKKNFSDLKQPVALYVGRVAIEKNLEAFLSMKWQGSKVIVGEGPSLQSLSRRYPDAVFAGKKTGRELADHYRSADLFVFPSRTDTFGIVILEALACGLPVAAYNVSGPKDIITEDFLGALDDHDLQQAAQRALNAEDTGKRVDYIKTHYTWENAAIQFEEGIKRTLVSRERAI